MGEAVSGLAWLAITVFGQYGYLWLSLLALVALVVTGFWAHDRWGRREPED